ncbi:cell division protein FtsW [Streptomyces sp. Ncost-T10-10d]|nr:cell division protein FtsW [Streptomyces sp. Ncost-T10-10d]
MPAEESFAAFRGDRSRATAAISRALTPPLLAGASSPAPLGPALRVRSVTGSRRPSAPRSKGRSGGPGPPAAAVCGGCTSRHAGPGTAL